MATPTPTFATLPTEAPPSQTVQQPPQTPSSTVPPPTPPASNVTIQPTIFDAFLDIPHPAVSSKINEPRVIVAPPPGEAMEAAREVGKELATERGLAKIARFCFPEFDDQIHAREMANKPVDINLKSGADLNKYDISFQQFYFPINYNNNINGPYANSSSGPSHHTFAMQLGNGDRVYGHVRRYMPHHLVTKGTRTDVGRRGLRSMVILTRANGGEKFYRALLKCLEAIKSQRTSCPPSNKKSDSPQKKLLHFIHQEHARLLKSYKPNQANSIIVIPDIEFKSPHFTMVDQSKLILPHTLVAPYKSKDGAEISSAPILPLLRCVGVAHILRLLSALLCERRIILVSKSPARLAACTNAAASMLAQGVVHWQHLYIPILPPGMKAYLDAPMPYLVGLISRHARSLGDAQGLGQVVVLDLDMNDIQVYGGVTNHNAFIPDLLNRPMVSDTDEPGIAEILKEDLLGAVKMDRKIMGDVAARGSSDKNGKSKGLLRGFGKLKRGIEKTRSQAMVVDNDFDNGDDAEEMYLFGEGVENEAAENMVKNAFTSFFICLLGDMKTYLRPKPGGGLPSLDKDLFMYSRQQVGDQRGTPMFAVLAVFKETQIFEQFVKARIEERMANRPLPPGSPLFLRVTEALRSHRSAYNPSNARQATAQLSRIHFDDSALRHSSEYRKRTMALTSNSRNELTASKELVRIVIECREGTYVLAEVMSVVWERLRDCRGMQWKHALFALQVIKELILQGPVSAITEVTDGLSRIRNLKFYENMRQNATQQVRSAAISVYNLVINRTKLFSMRRVCALSRKNLLNPVPSRKQNRTLMKYFKNFAELHKQVRPGGPVPSADLLNTESQDSMPSSVQPSVTSYSNDLLDLGLAASASVSAAPSLDAPQPPVTLASSPPSNMNELQNTFNMASLSQSPPSHPSAVTQHQFAQPPPQQMPQHGYQVPSVQQQYHPSQPGQAGVSYSQQAQYMVPQQPPQPVAPVPAAQYANPANTLPHQAQQATSQPNQAGIHGYPRFDPMG